MRMYFLVLILLTNATFAWAESSAASRELNEQGVAALQSHDLKKSEALFRKAYTSDPKNLTAGYNLAGAYLAEGKNQLAVVVLQDLAKKDPKDASVMVRLGDALFSAERPAEALKAYQVATSLDAKYPKLMQKIGTVYSLTGDLKASEEALLQAVQQSPEDYDSLRNLANVFLANSKPDKAISTVKRALQIKPSADLYVTLGSAYEMKKDYPNALFSFHKAHEVGGLGKQEAQLNQRIADLEKVTARAQAASKN